MCVCVCVFLSFLCCFFFCSCFLSQCFGFGIDSVLYSIAVLVVAAVDIELYAQHFCMFCICFFCYFLSVFLGRRERVAGHVPQV